MTTERTCAGWTTAAILLARLIFAAVFAMAVTFKLIDVGATAGYIAAVGLPFPSVLAVLAIIFEIALVVSLLVVSTVVAIILVAEGDPVSSKVIWRLFEIATRWV